MDDIYKEDKTVCLEISEMTLLRLIKEHAVNVRDISCLDKQSKEAVRRSFLQCAINSF